MKHTQLGSSGLQVTDICLGTMTWGIQNTQADADAQIEMALGRRYQFYGYRRNVSGSPW